MQAGGGLVEDVEGLPGIALGEFFGQLDALGFSPGQGGGLLAQGDIAQAHIVERFQFAVDVGNGLEEFYRLLHRHIQHIADGLAFVDDLQSLAVVAPAQAGFTFDLYVGQEVHLDHAHAGTTAGLAAAAFDVEGKPPGFIPPDFGFGQIGEDLSDVGEDTGVGRWIRTRGAPDGRLVDLNYLIHMLQPLEFLVGHGAFEALVEMLSQNGVEGLVDQRGFAAAGNAGHTAKSTQRNFGIDLLEVVAGGAVQLKALSGSGAALFRYFYFFLCVEVVGGKRIAFDELGGRALPDQFAAVLAGAGAQVDHIVGSQHNVFIMLYHQDGISNVTKLAQGFNQLLVVALMQADTGFIQDVGDAGQLGADLGGEADALRLAAGKRPGRAIEAQVVEPNMQQEAQPQTDLLEDIAGNELLAIV